MLRIPRALCRSVGRISSAKGSCQIEVDVLLEPDAGLPVWNMNDGMTLWMGELL